MLSELSSLLKLATPCVANHESVVPNNTSDRHFRFFYLQVKSRVAFGKPLVQQGSILQDIAESRIEIEQARCDYAAYC